MWGAWKGLTEGETGWVSDGDCNREGPRVPGQVVATAGLILLR